MYITNKIAFLHVPKTGGTTIMHYLPRLLDMNIEDPKLQMGVTGLDVRYHKPILFMKDEHRHIPRFGFIRNPWAWYISYASWCVDIKGDGPTWRIFSEGLKPGTPEYFTDTIKRMLSVTDGTDVSKKYIERMKRAYKSIGPRGRYMTPYNYFDRVREFRYGYFTWWVNSIFYNTYSPEPQDSVDVGRLENLTEDYLRIVGKHVDLTPEYIEEIRTLNAQRVRKNKHPYQDHYDMELASLVYSADNEIINRFGYTFEQEEKLS